MRESYCRMARCIDRQTGEFIRCARAVSLRHQTLHGGPHNGPLPKESLCRYTESELANVEFPTNCVNPKVFVEEVEDVFGGKYPESIKESVGRVKNSRGIT